MPEALKTAADAEAKKDNAAPVNPHDVFFQKLSEIFPGCVVFRDPSEVDNSPDPVWRPHRKLQTVNPAEGNDKQRKPGAPTQPRRSMSD